MLHASRYFRMSVTDRCNLSCYFCHREGQGPGGGLPLGVEDFLWVAQVAREEGFAKFKLTGGEPTLLPGLGRLVRGLRDLEVEDLSLITNGTLLEERAGELKRAGLPRLNVSVHTLDAEIFRKDHGGSPALLRKVVRGIDAALEAGLADVKLNLVYRGRRSAPDLEAVSRLAARRNLTVVLLPLMATGENRRPDDEETTLEELYELLKARGIRHEAPVVDGEGIVKRLATLEDGTRVLLRVDELGERLPYGRCADCSRRGECREGIFPVRLSADGSLRPCLAGGRPAVPLGALVRRRDADGVRRAFRRIREEKDEKRKECG